MQKLLISLFSNVESIEQKELEIEEQVRRNKETTEKMIEAQNVIEDEVALNKETMKKLQTTGEIKVDDTEN